MPDNIDQAAFEVVNFQETKAAGNGRDRRKQSTLMVRPDDDSDYELDKSINCVADVNKLVAKTKQVHQSHVRNSDRDRNTTHARDVLRQTILSHSGTNETIRNTVKLLVISVAFPVISQGIVKSRER